MPLGVPNGPELRAVIQAKESGAMRPRLFKPLAVQNVNCTPNSARNEMGMFRLHPFAPQPI